jgi:hypothetical protein
MNQKGSTTLIAEALILVLVVLTGFLAVRFLFSQTEAEMKQSSSWVECGNVLDCPSPE